MRIERLDGFHLHNPDAAPDRIDTYTETFLVRVETDTGHVGLGESHHAAAASAAFLHSGSVGYDKQGVAAVLRGRDPRDPAALMAELDLANFATARRGVGKGVLAAVDTALWDLASQARGLPLWSMLWGDAARPPRAYGTVHTGQAPFEETLRRLPPMIERCLAHGYGALKAEPTIDCTPEDKVAEYCERFRDLLPPSAELYVDFGYRMPDAARALAAIAAIEHLRPVFVETPCVIDDLFAWRDIVRASPVPIAGAELLESPWEFETLMDYCGVRIVQPWANRIGVGGVADVVARARRHDARVVAGGWNATPVGVAATLHCAAGMGDGITMEHPPTSAYQFGLRAIATPDFSPRAGVFDLPRTPGLGVVLDDAALARFRV